jgi:hypothetical protein
MDALVASFVPNSECTNAVLVPVANLHGTRAEVRCVDGVQRQLRVKLGHLRIKQVFAMLAAGAITSDVGAVVTAGNSNGDNVAGGSIYSTGGATCDDVGALERRRLRFMPIVNDDASKVLERRRERFSHPVDAHGALASVKAQRAQFAAEQSNKRRIVTHAEGSDDSPASELQSVWEATDKWEAASAHVNTGGHRGHLVWQRNREFHMLNFCGGRRRRGDIELYATADGSHCHTQDRKINGVGGEDLEDPVERERFRQDSFGQYDCAHMSWDCFSWSGALSLPPVAGPVLATWATSRLGLTAIATILMVYRGCPLRCVSVSTIPRR